MAFDPSSAQPETGGFDPSTAKPATLGGELKKGIAAGVDSLQGAGYGLMGLAGDAIGNDSLRDAGLAGYQRNQEEAAASAPAIGTYRDVTSLRDAGLYLANGLGQLAPFAAGSLVSAGTGGLIAGGVRAGATKAAERFAENRLAQGVAAAAGRVTPGAGAMAGAAANSIGTEQGLIYGDIHEKTGEYAPGTAALYGAAAGALDVIPELALASRVLGKGASHAAAEGFTKGLAKQTALEASTEAGQSAVENLAVQDVDPSQRAFSEDNLHGMVDSAILGAAGGAVSHTGGHLVGKVLNRNQPEQPAAPAGPLSKAVQAMPGLPAPDRLGLPAPDTLYTGADGQTSTVGPNINVDGTIQPAAQSGHAFVAPGNSLRPLGGEGMERQTPQGQTGRVGEYQPRDRELYPAAQIPDQSVTLRGETVRDQAAPVDYQAELAERDRVRGYLPGPQQDAPQRGTSDIEQPATPEAPKAEAAKAQPQTDAGEAKWFGSKDKAAAYIERRGLGDTHEVRQNAKRFEIQPKAAPTDVSDEAFAAAQAASEQGRQELADRAERAARYKDLEDQSRAAYSRGHAITHDKQGLRTHERAPSEAEHLEAAGHFLDSSRLRIEAARAYGKEPGHIQLQNYAKQEREYQERKARFEAKQQSKAEAAPDALSDEQLQLKSRHTKVDATLDQMSDNEVSGLYLRAGLGNNRRSVVEKRLALKDLHPDDIEPLLKERTEDAAAKVKAKATPAPSKADKRSRTIEQLGDVGHRFTLSTDVGYASAGKTYTIEAIDKDGTAHIRSATGGTSLRRFDLTLAMRDQGTTVAKLGTEDAAPAATGPEVGQKVLMGKGRHEGTVTAVKDGRVVVKGAGAAKGMSLDDFNRRVSEAEQAAPAATEAKPAASANTIFTEDAAAKARALLKSKLGQLNSGVDPEILQAGITLAGYHIEKGARSFAAYVTAMTGDLGDVVRPYLKSWYMGVKYDPRATGFDGMSSAAEVEGFDLDAREKAPAAAAVPAGVPGRTGLTQSITTPSGRVLSVRPKIVEAADLVVSNDDSGAINPAYPQHLQPRDRTRASSEMQVNDLAANMNPHLLGMTQSATDGAPIVGPDSVVESGNGRTMAIKRAYARNLPSAQEYRAWIEDQGYKIDGMKAPVMVRERVTALDDAERRAFTVEANERTTLSQSASERALQDARELGDIIDQYRGGDVGASQNQGFVRAFMQDVVSKADRGNMMDAEGLLSQDGRRRMEAALMAAAYEDAGVVAELFENSDNDIRAIGGALLDVSGSWAQLRQAARDEQIPASMDITPNVIEAVNLVRKARASGRPVSELVNQNDIFAGDLDPITQTVVSWFYRGDNLNRARGRDKLADILRDYVTTARAAQPGANMFGEPELTGAQVAGATRDKAQRTEQRTEQQAGQQTGLFGSGGFGGGVRTRGEQRQGSEPEQPGAAAEQRSPVTEATPPATLADAFYERLKAGTLPRDNNGLRKLVESIDGKPVDNARLKQGQEDLEAALVRHARDIVARNADDKVTFNQLVREYEQQPNLNVRTSTSIANQAYSTPAPLAYAASELALIGKGVRVYEPTAGNGMLLIGADPKLATANELNDHRFANLQALGFDAIQGDALDALSSGVVMPGSQDAVITNPPFGSVKDADGKATKVAVDGFKLGQIDHQIAAESLKAMKDDGRAVLILGANKVAGGLSTDDRIFFNWLYSHYNVTGHFELDGKLYARQGASWPVRVITINGRQASSRVSPAPGTIARATTWDEVYQHYANLLGAQERAAAPADGAGRGTAERAGDERQPAPAADGRQSRAPGEGSGRAGQGRAADVDGARARAADDQPGSRAGALADRDNAQRSDAGRPGRDRLEPAEGATPAGKPDSRSAAGAKSAEPAGSPLADADNAFQTKYVPRSARKDEGVLVPVNMAQPLQDALNTLEDQVGDIDQFAARELGYGSAEDLHNALMGLQVDSVASAIYQLKEHGKGIVIADQTGIGKGRQAAAMIRWAARNGHIPVFLTVKPQLFTDMHGDLADIGSRDIHPFIMNSDGWIKGENGERLYANKDKGHRKTLEAIAASGRLPEGSNALFLTYSQINTKNTQRDVLTALAQRAIVVMDESHNAGGDSQTGEYIRGLLEMVKGVTYLSATYAKRPDNMPVYHRTDIGAAISDSETLMTAMASGGLPLQTVVSANLVKAGQMFRRERSYDGVSIETVVDAGNRKLHEKMSDEATSALRAIVAADRRFHDGFVKELKKQLEEAGEALEDVAGNQAVESVDHTEFSSVVHNFVRQMLLGLKADTAAEHAIAAIKRGEKPLIALENTMGSFLNEYAENNGLTPGQGLGDFSYRTVLSRALERTRYIRRVLPNGEKVKEHIPLGKLDDATREAYRDAQRVIDSLDLGDIPVSPLDWIRHRIEQAGHSVAEITGRNLAVDYSKAKPVLSQVDLKEQKDKVATTQAFNSGKLDAIILNVSGSTGISLHASEKFKDQRPRRMIVAQAAQDINIFMQMLGRIHRTGQVRLPAYTILNVDLPAEKRPTALLNKKMKSLNANTSSNTESATSIKSADMLNKYGDTVVANYLADDTALALELGLGGNLVDGNGIGTEDVARKATGRMALMPVERQIAFYNEVEEQYDSLMSYLNDTNQNDLEPRTFDFAADLQEEQTLVDATNPASPFGQEAVYGEYRIKAQGKQMTPVEVRAEMAENLAGATGGAAHARALAESLRKLDKRDSEDGGGQREGDTFIQHHPIGSLWRVDINGDNYNAVITNLRSTHKKAGSPFAMSKVQVTLAVNGPLRSITVPASQWKRIEIGPLNSYHHSVESLFQEQAEGMDTAKIVTGNLLAAYGELVNTTGTIISFTKKDGSIEQGILLPRKFKMEDNARHDFQFRAPADAATFLKQSTNPNIERFGIASRDALVRVLPDGQGIKIQVPKSKARGGKYFLDERLLAQTGDFVSSGNFMIAKVPARRVFEALRVLMGKTPLYAAPSMADDARQVLGLPPKDGPRFQLGQSARGASRVLTRDQVQQLTVKTVGDVAARNFVFTDFYSLPQEIQDDVQASGAVPSEVRAVHWNGKTYMVDGRFATAEEAQQAIFHEHYVHFGLRAKYGQALVPQLRELLAGIGGIEGLRKLAAEQNLAARMAGYEQMVEANEDIRPALKPLVLMEELLAHMGESTGTLKRTIEEFLGRVRAWLRSINFPGLAKLNAADLAHVLKGARKAAQQAAGDANGRQGDKPLYQMSERDSEADSLDRPMYSAGPSQADLEALRKLGLVPEEAKGVLAKLAEFVQGDMRSKLDALKARANEGIFDGLAGIRQAEEAVGITGERRGYVSARLATGLPDVMHGLLHYGAPQWKDGVLQYKPGTRGLLEVLADLGGDNLTDWLAWVGAKRAELLAAEGRENNLAPAEIQRLLARAGARAPLFQKVYAEYAKMNTAMLDVAEHAGLISAKQRANWMSDYYIPFYRMAEDEDGTSTLLAPNTKQGLSHQTAAIKRLMGGDIPTADLLSNILTNWSKRLDASLKNRALLDVVDNLKDTPYLEAEPNPGAPARAQGVGFARDRDDIIRVQRDGKDEFYKVKDKPLLRAVTAMSGMYFKDPVTTLGRKFKRLLTTGVTAAPDFMLRNFLRDSAQAWITNPDKFKLGIDSVKGLRAAFAQDADYRDLMFGGASFAGGYANAADPEAAAESIRRALKAKGLTKAQQDSYLSSLADTTGKMGDALAKGWEKYREFGERIENANRLATYKRALEAGKSRRQAAFEAKDLMDFSMRGNFTTLQWLTDVVPFLNARLQGLGKLGRSYKDDKGQLLGQVILKAGIMAAVSLALAALNGDDERYQQLPEWDKDANWHFWFSADQVEPIRIPKPFELGLIFATLPERLLHFADGTQDAGRLGSAVARGVVSTLSFNPIPQFYMPIRDIQANRNLFFDTPIEGFADEGKLPEARYDENTSLAARALGQLTGPTLGLSPKQLDYLVKGYTGTLGAYVLGASDMVAHGFSDTEQPAMAARHVPLLSVVYKGSSPGSTQYQTDVYDMVAQADQLYRTAKAFRAEGKVEEAQELLQDNADKLKHRPALGLARQQLGAIRKQMDMTYRNESLDADAKRARLDELQTRANTIAERVSRLARPDF